LHDLDHSPNIHTIDFIPVEQDVKLDEEDLKELDHEANKDKKPKKQGASPFCVVWVGIITDVVNHVEGSAEHHKAI